MDALPWIAKGYLRLVGKLTSEATVVQSNSQFDKLSIKELLQ